MMSIKRFMVLAIMSISVLLLLLFVNIYWSQQVRHEIVEKEKARFNSLRLAKELLQSSDDLTRMARAYGVTGNSVYKEYYYQILAIRDGHIPRPYSDSSTYWHLEGIGMAPGDFKGKAVALIDLMRQEGGTDEELLLFKQAKINSDRLVEIERQAFNVVEGISNNSNPDEYATQGKSNSDLAKELLWGEEYIGEKAKIMLPIKQFIDTLDVRTQDELDAAQIELKNILIYEYIIFILLLLSSAAIIAYTWKYVISPLQLLIRGTELIANGDYDTQCAVIGSNEISNLVISFNKMMVSITDTMAQREQVLNLLQINEIRLLEAQRQARIGYWDTELSNDKSYWSDPILDILELDSSNVRVSYEGLLNTTHPDDRSKVDQAYRNLLINHQQYEINHRLLMPDGRIKWVCQRGMTVFDKSDQPVRVLVTVQEISKQKELELFLDYQLSSMNERLKELKCLNQLADLSRKSNQTIAHFLESVVQVIQPAWSRPDLVCIRIEFDGRLHQTEKFEVTVHVMSVPIIIEDTQRGKIEIFHQETALNTNPFLPEEYQLLDTISQQVSQTIDKKLNESKIRLYASVFEQSREAIAICDRRGCKNFCVNGHLAGNCYYFLRSRNDCKQRIDRQPTG